MLSENPCRQSPPSDRDVLGIYWNVFASASPHQDKCSASLPMTLGPCKKRFLLGLWAADRILKRDH